MHRPRAAERQERELAWVDAAVDGHDPQRADHLRVCEAHDAGRRLKLIEPELLARAPSTAAEAASGVELELARQARIGRQASEHEIRVGDRRVRASSPVTGGPGIGARGLGPDAKRSSVVHPADRAAARAHGVDVDHRELDHAASDLPRLGDLSPAVLDHADVA